MKPGVWREVSKETFIAEHAKFSTVCSHTAPFCDPPVIYFWNYFKEDDESTHRGEGAFGQRIVGDVDHYYLWEEENFMDFNTAFKVASLKDHVKGSVRFQYYRDGNLFYKTETDLLFPVPIDDIGNATFLAEDKAMFFMRYIRKFLDTLEKK